MYRSKNRIDGSYDLRGQGLVFHPMSAACGQWIARYVTTNVAEAIYFDRAYGMGLISQMQGGWTADRTTGSKLMKINVLTLRLPRSRKTLDTELRLVLDQPLDNLPLIGSVAEAVEAVSSTRGNWACFRVADDPGILVVWRATGTLGSAALVVTLDCRRIVEVDLILLGSQHTEDTQTLALGREFLSLSDGQVAHLRQQQRPLLVRFRAEDDRQVVGIWGMLPLILYVPMLAEMSGVE